MSKPPRSPRMLRVLDTLQGIAETPSEDGSTRVLACGLISEILGAEIDFSVGVNPSWKEAFIRLRHRVRKIKNDAPKRKFRNVTNALQQIRKLQNEEMK